MTWSLEDLWEYPFDEKDWAFDVTREVLVSSLISFESEFEVDEWADWQITHFLDINFHLMNGEMKQSHRRTIITIIQQGERIK